MNKFFFMPLGFKNSSQRSGIAAGGLFYNVQPGTAAWLVLKLKLRIFAWLYSSSPNYC
jgi:hypothetical protein